MSVARGEENAREANVVTRLLAGWVVTLAACQIVTVSLSLLRVQINGGIAAAILALSASLGAWTSRYRLGSRSEAAPGSETGTTDRFVQRLTTYMIAVCGIMYMVLWCTALANPDASWDGLAYHIPPIAYWSQKGYLHWVSPCYTCESFVNGYAKGAEVVGYLLVTVLHSSSVLNSFNLVFLPLGVLGIASIAMTMGVRPPLALTCGCLYVLVPVNINQAATTYVDSAYGSCVLASFAIALHVLQALIDGRGARASALLLGTALGLAASVKGSGLLLGPIVVLVLLVVSVAQVVTRRESARVVAWRGVRTVCLLTAMAFLVSGYWYLRDWVYGGSPIYPMGLTLGPWELCPGREVAEVLGEQRQTPSWMRSRSSPIQVAIAWSQIGDFWATSVRHGVASLAATDSRSAGWGFFWGLACVPSIVAVGWRLNRAPAPLPVRWLWLTLVLMIVLLFLATPMRWWSRYSIWMYGLGLPSLALLLEFWSMRMADCHSAIRTRHFAKSLAKAWLVLCVGVLLLEAVVCATLQQRCFRVSQEGFDWVGYPHRGTNYMYPDLSPGVLDEVFASSEPVALGPMDHDTTCTREFLIGTLAQPIGRRKLLQLPAKVEQTHAEMLAQERVRYVLLSDADPVPETLRQRAVRIQQIRGFWILVMEPPSPLPPIAMPMKPPIIEQDMGQLSRQTCCVVPKRRSTQTTTQRFEAVVDGRQMARWRSTRRASPGLMFAGPVPSVVSLK
jgi:hypothetical protein